MFSEHLERTLCEINSTYCVPGKCLATLQHPDSQVNAMEISPDGQLLAACGYQHIRMFDVNNTKPNPVVNFEGVSKNVMAVGFQDEGRWMYTGLFNHSIICH